MAREARHFVDEAFFVIFGKYLAEFSKSCLILSVNRIFCSAASNFWDIFPALCRKNSPKIGSGATRITQNSCRHISNSGCISKYESLFEMAVSHANPTESVTCFDGPPKRRTVFF